MISKLHFESTRLIVDSCDLVEKTLKTPEWIQNQTFADYSSTEELIWVNLPNVIGSTAERANCRKPVCGSGHTHTHTLYKQLRKHRSLDWSRKEKTVSAIDGLSLAGTHVLLCEEAGQRLSLLKLFPPSEDDLAAAAAAAQHNSEASSFTQRWVERNYFLNYSSFYPSIMTLNLNLMNLLLCISKFYCLFFNVRGNRSIFTQTQNEHFLLWMADVFVYIRIIKSHSLISIFTALL